MVYDMKGIPPPGAPARPSGTVPAGRNPGSEARPERFEDLLRELSEEVDALKERARTLPHGIDRAPLESFRHTLAEADRNFESALTVGRTLLRAYRTLVPPGTPPSLPGP